MDSIENHRLRSIERCSVDSSYYLAVLIDDYPNTKVVGHRDLPGVKKDCPCFEVKKKGGGEQKRFLTHPPHKTNLTNQILITYHSYDTT